MSKLMRACVKAGAGLALLGTTACFVGPDGRLWVPRVVTVGLPPPVVTVSVPPPAPQYEAPPPAAPGQVWVAGQWLWVGNQYSWKPGYYIAGRPGYTYYPSRWVVVGRSYRMIPGFYRPAGRPAPVYRYRTYRPPVRVQVYRP